MEVKLSDTPVCKPGRKHVMANWKCVDCKFSLSAIWYETDKDDPCPPVDTRTFTRDTCPECTRKSSIEKYRDSEKMAIDSVIAAEFKKLSEKPPTEADADILEKLKVAAFDPVSRSIVYDGSVKRMADTRTPAKAPAKPLRPARKMEWDRGTKTVTITEEVIAPAVDVSMAETDHDPSDEKTKDKAFFGKGKANKKRKRRKY